MSTETVQKWLAALGTLCAGSMPAEEARTKISAYAPMLEGRYEAWAFGRRSLEAVASGSKFWPSYGELCEKLDAWCRDHRPVSDAPRLEGPEIRDPAAFQAKLDADDRRYWEEHLADIARRPHPDYRWVRAMEISQQVSQADSFPRPWIVPLLRDIIQEAEEDGANTSLPIEAARPYPQKGETLAPPRVRSVPRRPEDMKAKQWEAA